MHMLIFGAGYSATRLARRLREQGWAITAIRRAAGKDVLAFDDEAAVTRALAGATHILSSVPPDAEGDPVLTRYGALIATAPARWVGYLSSTGVYGDTGGAWVDESAPVGGGRRNARVEADRAWQALRPDLRVFRLPGIYGPGRSALDRVRAGNAHRIDLPDQVFSRIHVDDIGAAILASIERGPPGIFNIADARPASQNAVIEAACDLLGCPRPALQTLDEAGLSPMARAFYTENRRVSGLKAQRLLGWKPAWPTYREGLAAILAAENGAAGED